jgi:hypothetical protein
MGYSTAITNPRNPTLSFKPNSKVLEFGMAETISIMYGYDALYRLTAADYYDGTYFHYAYDSADNRLTE